MRFCRYGNGRPDVIASDGAESRPQALVRVFRSRSRRIDRRHLVTSLVQSTAGRGLLALGGAAFDDPTLFTGVRPIENPRGAKTPGAQSRGAGETFPPLHFDPPEAPSREVQDVAGLWTGSPVEVLEN